jgi:competence ComEA-like helix-hairpin-helix protein
MMSDEHDELVEEQEVAAEAKEVAVEPEKIADMDLNTATEEELSQLPGIGPVLAARIVNYRLEVHPFEEPVEITAVPGISETIYGRIADRLQVSPMEVAEVEDEPEPDLPVAEAEEPPAPEPEPPDIHDLPEPEPEPEAIRVEEIPTPRPIPLPPAAQGVGWGRVLLIGLASAIAGAILALLTLLIINGTLNFRTATVKALRVETVRLGEEIGRLDGNMGELYRRLEVLQELSDRMNENQIQIRELHEGLSAVRGEMEAMAQALGGVRQEFTNLREDLDGMGGLVSIQGRRLDEVEQRLNILGKELEEISGAAQRFDAFLGGLRHLLNESMGPPTPTPWMTPTPTPWKTPTPALMVTVIPMATPTP